MSNKKEKILVIAAGLKGGTAKSTTMSLVDAWYQQCCGIIPRCFDMDPGGTFRALTAAHSPYFDGEDQKVTEPMFDMKMITDSLVDEYGDKVYLVDMPSSSLDKVEASFSIVNWQDLESNYNMQVVILTVMTADTESSKMADDWKRLIPNASIISISNGMNGEVVEEGDVVFPLHTGKSTVGSADASAKTFIDAVKRYKWNWSYLSIPFSTRYTTYLKSKHVDEDISSFLVTTRRKYSQTVNKSYWGNIVASSFGAKLDQFYDGLDKVQSRLLPTGSTTCTYNTEAVFIPNIEEYLDKYSSVSSFADFDKSSTDLSEDAVSQSAEFFEEMKAAEEEL
jgi:hypothetical protein